MSLYAALPEPYVSFSFAHPMRVPVALARVVRMQGKRLLQPPRRAAVPGSPRIVVSLSTLPSRIGRLVPVLNSLIDQDLPADEIVLALPQVSRREKVRYTIPDFIRESSAVTVLEGERDWGPATKLIPALLREQRPDTLIVAVDDDNVYPRNMISSFAAAAKAQPGAALCYRGWVVPPSLDYKQKRVRFATTVSRPMDVDIITGTWGFMVQPDFFDDGVTDYSGYPDAAFFVDDIWFSGHLARRGIPRVLFPAADPPISTLASVVNALGVVENADGAKDNAVLGAFEPYWSCRRSAAATRRAA